MYRDGPPHLAGQATILQAIRVFVSSPARICDWTVHQRGGVAKAGTEVVDGFGTPSELNSELSLLLVLIETVAYHAYMDPHGQRADVDENARTPIEGLQLEGSTEAENYPGGGSNRSQDQSSRRRRPRGAGR